MSKAVVSPEDQVGMVEMFEGGSTYREIAKHYERTVDEVSLLLSALGLSRKKLRHRHNEVYDMVEAGLSNDEICAKTGYSKSSVSTLLTKQKHIRKSRANRERA